MPSIRWIGPRPPPALQRELDRNQFSTTSGADALCSVVMTPQAAPPRPPAGLWLWVHGGTPTPEQETEAILAGAYAVLPVEGAADKLVARLKELVVPPPPVKDASSFVAESTASQAVLSQIALAARTSQPVLITGETGTGKEVTARLLHAWSARAKREFVAINCAAIPNELMESELFGYVRGAFSGAVRDYDGQFAAAEGGTVFLDEIDDTPLSLQVKLLRVLEDGVVSRLGENVWRKIDFRLLAATNVDLKPLIAERRFGADLYERMAIVHIHLPPLRERQEDLPTLVGHMIARFYEVEPDAKAKGIVREVEPAAMRALTAYPWPGNIRELRNVLFEALVYKRAGDVLLLSDLPKRVLLKKTLAAPRQLIDEVEVERRIDAGAMNLREELENLERTALRLALVRARGNASQAARLLGGVGRGQSSDPGSTVRAMMKRLGLDRE